MTTVIIKTKSAAPFALVKLHFGKPEYGTVNGRYAVTTPAPFLGADLVGYAHSKSNAVLARARRLSARILPIVNGKVTVEVEGY